MKLLIKMLLGSLLAVLLTLWVIKDPGYVLLAREPWVIEVSLAFFVILLLIAFLVFYGVIRFIKNTWAFPDNVHEWRNNRRHKRAYRSLTKGLMQLAQHQWKKAESLLLKNATDSETPLLNYLGAAHAAQEQGENSRRDSYLSQAYSVMPGAELAVGLTQADLQMRHGQLEQALASLRRLKRLDPSHTHTLKMLVQLYEELHDWHSLHDMLPELHKRHVLPDEEYLRLQVRVYAALLDESQHLTEKNHEAIWYDIPRALRDDLILVQAYARCLIANAEHEAARKLLKKRIRHAWQDELVALYGDVIAGEPNKQLVEAEAWLKEHPDSAVLLMVLGKLAGRAELWGKAQSYLEEAINVGAGAEAYHMLAELLEEHGDRQRAAEIYRKGLNVALGVK